MSITACNQTKETPLLNKGIEKANLDTTVVPGDDFYRYACGGWMDNHPLKPEFSRFGTFDELRETSQEQVKALIAELSKKEQTMESAAQKIGDLYAIATDSAKLNQEGASPLQAQLQDIEAINDKKQLSAKIASLSKQGINPFFGFYVYADDKNSSMNIFHLIQGGFNMGDRDYYLENDDRSKEISSKYIEYIEKVFALAGYTSTQANDASTAIMKIESQLALKSYTREDLRIPEKNYHKISLEELQKTSPNIDWKVFFETIGLSQLKELNLAQAEPIAEVSKLIKDCSLEEIKYYLSWNTINASTSFLSDDFTKASFMFYGKTLSGKEELNARWKRAVDVVNGTLGEAVGQLYVAKHFPPAAKERMLSLVGNLQTALGERIDNLTWMGDSTKLKAHEKLQAFHVKIGYPDQWRDYSKLEIDKSKSYWHNILASNEFDFEYMIDKFDKPVDTNEWHMTPQTVNAYYNPATNEICFPAAILQAPFFNMEADDAVNYGAIGVVIGHEMTHGFDDQGRQYDKDGNLSDWWTAQDAKNFDDRAQTLVDFFNNIIVVDDVHANGRYTLGENIADHGGLQVSWQAFNNSLKDKEEPSPILGFTAAQRFFLGYATVWAGNLRKEEILRLTKVDSHSLGEWRVNAALPQIDAWYDAFDVKESNNLFVPKQNRASIW